MKKFKKMCDIKMVKIKIKNQLKAISGESEEKQSLKIN